MSTKIKFFLGALAVAAFAVTTSVGAQTYTFSGTLKQGSKGVSVWNLQKFLNMCPTTKVAAMGAGSSGMETKTFGPATKAAVIRFQAANGLSADGIFGAMSAAKALSLQASGNACGQVVVTPPPSNNGNGGSNNGPTLSGTDGTISDVKNLTSYSNEKVGEGSSNTKVAGLEVKASNDGDIALKSIKLTLTYAGAGSNRLNRYVDGVSVWQGSTKVGSANVEDFNKDSSGVYSKTVTIDNAVVRADKTEKFYITVDGANTFDSTDISAGTDWNLGVDSIRFVDGSGVVTTDATAGNLPISAIGINFVDFSSAADTELRISKDSDSPAAGIVVVDKTNSTDNVTLLKGTLKLKGTSDTTINTLPVTFTVASGVLNEVANNLTLVLDGKEYSESSTTTSGDTSATVAFDNLDFKMSAGDTVNFVVKADINGSNDFPVGQTITAAISSDNRSGMDVENEKGDQVADSDKTGTAAGDAQEFRSSGISVALVGTPTATSNSDATLGTYTINFKVTAVGDDAYIGTVANSSKYTYTFSEASAGATTSGFSAAITNNGGSGNSTTKTTGGNWKIAEGTSVTLSLQVFGQGASLSAGAWRAALTGIYWSTSDSAAITTTDNNYTSNMTDFHTDYLQLI